MRKLFIAVFWVVTWTALCAAAIAFGDRQTLVSPPDGTAEGFLRAVATGRLDRAKPFLAEGAKESQLGEIEQQIKLATGEADDVNAEVRGEIGPTTEVEATVSGPEGELFLLAKMVFENNEWHVSEVRKEGERKK